MPRTAYSQVHHRAGSPAVVRARGGHPLRPRRLVERLGLALDNLQRTGRALTDASPQPIAQVVGNHAGLVVDNRQRPFGTAGDTLAAAITQFFIDLDDLSNDFHKSKRNSYAQESLNP